MKGQWYLGYNAEEGGEPDEIIGGDRYEGYIWLDGGRNYKADEIWIDSEEAAERVVALLNERQPLLDLAPYRALAVAAEDVLGSCEVGDAGVVFCNDMDITSLSTALTALPKEARDGTA